MFRGCTNSFEKSPDKSKISLAGFSLDLLVRSKVLDRTLESRLEVWDQSQTGTGRDWLRYSDINAGCLLSVDSQFNFKGNKSTQRSIHGLIR